MERRLVRRQEEEKATFEEDLRGFLRKLERRGLEADVTSIEEETAYLNVFRVGTLVSGLKVTPREKCKCPDAAVKAECVKCHAIMACPFYGSEICPRFGVRRREDGEDRERSVQNAACPKANSRPGARTQTLYFSGESRSGCRGGGALCT